jgi:L-2-hydroxyglutarate oxidase
MVALCREHGIEHEVTGKLIVATEPDELPRLDELERRAEAHGLAVERLGPAGIADREPHAAGIAALWVPSTGIVDFGAVGRLLGQLLEARGVQVRTGVTVTGLERDGREQRVLTDEGDVRAGVVVGCAGLHSDRLARLGGVDPGCRIVPFRGEYYELSDEASPLVRGLIYPVPDPAFPFLGVHLTRVVGGHVHAGPNAVVALRREGYRRRDITARDVLDTATYPGFWRLARRHAGDGLAEMARSASKRLFLRSLRRLVPDLELDHLRPAPAGVRAQALTPDGKLVDDFLFVEAPGQLHVCNAPSPAATASLEIGKEIASRLHARRAAS